jgi:hypothetical protein
MDEKNHLSDDVEDDVIVEDEEHIAVEEEEGEGKGGEGDGLWRRHTGERREVYPTGHDEEDEAPLMGRGGRGEGEEEEDDNDIIVELRPKGLPRRKESLSNLISENRKRLGIVPTPLSVAVHNLSLSVHVTVAKTEARNILQDVRERLRIDERKTVKKLLLRNVSMYLKENMMLLILGPPGHLPA